MNFQQARYNMIEQQVRPWDVLSQQVLSVMEEVHREDFVPTEFKQYAYADTRLPIGHNQKMMPPTLEGRMIQALEIKESDQVLEVGTGSGYITACLAKLAKTVNSIDIYSVFTEQAKKILAQKGVINVELETADVMDRPTQGKNYDAIVVTSSVETIPEQLKEKLKINGKMFVIIGSQRRPIMHANLVVRYGENEWLNTPLFETAMPPLENQQIDVNFTF